MTYTLGLALEDFVPVILSSIGLYILSQMVYRLDNTLGFMAQAGWVLITVGGVLKATWKLTMALTATQVNLVWLDKGMFLWMAPGFTLMAFAIWFTAELMTQGKRPSRIWPLPSAILGLMVVMLLFTGFPDITVNTWRFALLGIMTLSNVILMVLLIQKARRFNQSLTAGLFLLNIVLVFVLSGLARIPEQTIPLQWTEQILNTIAQGAFLYGAWQLAQTIQLRRPQIASA